MAAKEVEKNILDRELNSHAMNSSMLEPPKFYSEVPTLTSIQKLNEVLKIFPRAGKFSGNLSRDNGVSVCEYLNSLTSAQNQCLLSEEEFIDRIIGSCTAQAHDLVMDWKLNGNSASEIYSNLINNFDNRMSISEAKQRLATFVIYKNSSLAKAEAAILHLLTRASADFLPGPTRIAYRDIEGIRALIEALPNTSRIQARTLERSYSAKRGRACTFQELIKGLEQFRDMIDRDIKENGASPNMNMKRVMNQNKYTSVPYRNNPVKKNISSNYSSFLAEKRTEQIVPQFKKNSSNYRVRLLLPAFF
jgi:hypothetical protein